MAFTGTAVVTKVSDRKFRITGLSLAGAASGTIALRGGTGDVEIDAPGWSPYVSAGLQGGSINLASAIKVDVVPADAAATAAVGSQTPAVVKTGTKESDFVATLTNRNGAGVASGALEIWVEFH